MATILVVDNDKNVLDAYVATLKADIPDATILTSKNELEAIDLINSHENIDVVITDLRMNHPDGGFKVLNAAKKKDPLIMVIVVTAYHETLNRKDAFFLGAFDCINKANDNDDEEEDELVFKTKNAISFRETYKLLIESETKINSFEKYFDPTVFEKIKRDHTLLTPKNRTITIVFWDIRDFSSLSEKLKTDTELIAGFLKEFLESSCKIIFAHGGILDKFIGDGIMALFGVFDENDTENNHEQFTVDAVQTAIELKHAFSSIYIKWKKKWELVSADKIDIGLGCGIHTGTALVGNLGTDIRDHFTAIGPHVNFAARIEKSAQKGEIRFSQTTKGRILDRFNFRKLDTLTNIKNIGGSFDIFEIVE